MDDPRLAELLLHRFEDRELLEMALTHRSHSARHNERLEFLGDSVLNFLVASMLYGRFPDAPEGLLSRMRANLVKRDALAARAREMDLGVWLRLGSGELKSGGFDRSSTLADAFEALVGALYLDGGLAAAERFVGARFSAVIEILDPAGLHKDPKSRLQELLQKQGLELPSYEVLEVHGDPHAQNFVVECAVRSPDAGAPASRYRGEGRSRRGAEQSAASAALSALAGSAR